MSLKNLRIIQKKSEFDLPLELLRQVKSWSRSNETITTDDFKLIYSGIKTATDVLKKYLPKRNK